MLKRGMQLFLWIAISTRIFALDLELTQGISAALPIGINAFGYDDHARSLTTVITNDLKISGQFKILPAQGNGQSPLQYWQQAGADSVLSGEVVPTGDGRMAVSFKLVDSAAQGRQLLANNYVIQEGQLRALAHHISDEVYKKLTGERGVFSTKIAYILVQRGMRGARYSLEVADMDGFHPQNLLVSSEPIMSPAWSPDGQSIAYVSFEKKRAQIYKVDVSTGQRRLITSFSGINGAPAWSPSGRELAVVLSKEGTPKIYSVNMENGQMRQLTFGSAIDTEPKYSADGGSIIFTSGRGGSPQIYRLSLANGQVSRMSFNGNYNARASYTPNQQSIVMLHRSDRDFNIAVQDIHSGQVTTLTNSSMDESPSVAPNGRLVLYATHDRNQGILGMVSIDGRIRLKFPSRDGDIQEPAWSPYLG
ncbi:MAG: Tol-Pal system beta propeller repeat protein TolB [Legionellales bacterium]|jgi:TolB protein|nr:Tol-Pal system beta propeller repeat protein TolB [Legionellales bacterium]NDH68305.1 Tol-Pal system beta propeller repeat protein TolB [Gammaproteobacteria bacterium]